MQVASSRARGFWPAVSSDRLEAVQNALFYARCPGDHGFGQAMRSPRAPCRNLRSSECLQCAPWRVMEHEGLRMGIARLIGDAALAAAPPFRIRPSR